MGENTDAEKILEQMFQESKLADISEADQNQLSEETKISKEEIQDWYKKRMMKYEEEVIFQGCNWPHSVWLDTNPPEQTVIDTETMMNFIFENLYKVKHGFKFNEENMRQMVLSSNWPEYMVMAFFKTKIKQQQKEGKSRNERIGEWKESVEKTEVIKKAYGDWMSDEMMTDEEKEINTEKMMEQIFRKLRKVRNGLKFDKDHQRAIKLLTAWSKDKVSDWFKKREEAEVARIADGLDDVEEPDVSGEKTLDNVGVQTEDTRERMEIPDMDWGDNDGMDHEEDAEDIEENDKITDSELSENEDDDDREKKATLRKQIREAYKIREDSDDEDSNENEEGEEDIATAPIAPRSSRASTAPRAQLSLVKTSAALAAPRPSRARDAPSSLRVPHAPRTLARTSTDEPTASAPRGPGRPRGPRGLVAPSASRSPARTSIAPDAPRPSRVLTAPKPSEPTSNGPRSRGRPRASSAQRSPTASRFLARTMTPPTAPRPSRALTAQRAPTASRSTSATISSATSKPEKRSTASRTPSPSAPRPKRRCTGVAARPQSPNPTPRAGSSAAPSTSLSLSRKFNIPYVTATMAKTVPVGVEVDTAELAKRITTELLKQGIPQADFAQKILRKRSQGTLSDLLRIPKPWNALKQGQKVFTTMLNWLALDEKTRVDLCSLSEDDAAKVMGVTIRVKPAGTSSTALKQRFFFSDQQKTVLNGAFSKNPKPDNKEMEKLAANLELDFATVKNFFQNTRRKAKMVVLKEEVDD